jgi:hypothetical protein
MGPFVIPLMWWSAYLEMWSAVLDPPPYVDKDGIHHKRGWSWQYEGNIAYLQKKR